MYTASDLRKGLKIQIEGDPYVVVDFQFSKPGKGQSRASATCRANSNAVPLGASRLNR